MLDTRNGFEVDAGAFQGALDWRLARFSDFPAALQAHQPALQGKTVVSYCTGGIRCEKAALWMAQQGVLHVHQLEGGILRYFEELPDTPFWQGRCFVFDEREEIDPPRSAFGAPLQGGAANGPAKPVPWRPLDLISGA